MKTLIATILWLVAIFVFVCRTAGTTWTFALTFSFLVVPFVALSFGPPSRRP